MSYTFEVACLSELTAHRSGAIKAFDRSQMLIVGNRDANGGGQECTYRLAAGDADQPTTIRIGNYPKPTAHSGFGLVNHSGRLETYVTVKDEADAVVGVYPLNIVLSFGAPGKTGVPGAATIRDLAGALAAFIFGIAAADDILDTDGLLGLTFGVVGNQLAVTDAA